METPGVHHLVTIRLDEHVEQLERAYSAFLDVRNQLSDLHEVLEGKNPGGLNPPEGMEGAMVRLKGVLRTVGAALEMTSPISGEVI